MALFTWTDDFSVEVEAMDNQHKKLFNLINELYDALNDGKGTDIMNKVVKELVDYTKVHFKEEEEILEKINYGELGKQKEMHKVFIDKLNDLKGKVLTGNITAPMQTMSFLKDWLAKHIKVEDKKYAKYVNATV